MSDKAWAGFFLAAGIFNTFVGFLPPINGWSIFNWIVALLSFVMALVCWLQYINDKRREERDQDIYYDS